MDYPPTLSVLLRHNAQRIEFEKVPGSSQLRAACVVVQETTEEDIAPILSGLSFVEKIKQMFALFGRSRGSTQFNTLPSELHAF